MVGCNRTRVRKSSTYQFYMHSLSFCLTHRAPTDRWAPLERGVGERFRRLVAVGLGECRCGTSSARWQKLGKTEGLQKYVCAAMSMPRAISRNVVPMPIPPTPAATGPRRVPLSTGISRWCARWSSTPPISTRNAEGPTASDFAHLLGAHKSRVPFTPSYNSSLQPPIPGRYRAAYSGRPWRRS